MKVRDNSSDMLKKLEASIKNEATEIEENENTLSLLERHLRDAKEELKAIKKRKIKEIAKFEAQAEINPAAASQVEIIEETYAELEDETILRIGGLQTQINLTADKRNEIIRINRLARTVIDVFNDIIDKPKLDRTDLQLIIERITVYEDHIDVKLKADVDAILHAERLQEESIPVNFRDDSKVILNADGFHSTLKMEMENLPDTTKFRLKTHNQSEKLFTVNVISSGDPLEIFTDREGEIILKKYSPIGELSAFAKQYAESLSQTMGCLVCVCDMDQIVAAAGSGKKDIQEKYISTALQKELEERNSVLASKGDKKYIKVAVDQNEEYEHEVITPIICEGDVIGGVMLLAREDKKKFGNLEQKMAACAATFLGRQMEQ